MSSPDRSLVPAAVARRLPVLSLLTALWVAAFGLTVWHSTRPGPEVTRLDHQLQHVPHLWLQVANQLADLGDASRFAFVAVGIAAVCLLGRSMRSLVAAVASLAAVVVVVEWVLKPLVDSRLDPFGSATFPSGHAATAACLGTVAILLLGRSTGPLRLAVPTWVRPVITILGVLVGPAVGLAMVIVGAHSLTDLVAAVPLGVTLTLLTCALVDRMWRRPRRAHPSRPVGNSDADRGQPQDRSDRGVPRSVEEPRPEPIGPTVGHHT